jgi:hypothetical protein
VTSSSREELLLSLNPNTLPTASIDSRLTVLAGAKVAVPEGVNATVPKFTYNNVLYAKGVYGGVG